MRRAAAFAVLASASALMPQWDAAKGVWAGDRAAADAAFEPPSPPARKPIEGEFSAGVERRSPLWIFGYGSLCWKAEFPHEETRVGFVRGWSRYFAQRSADHRGTPEAPGLVCTVVRDADLEALGLRDAGADPSRCCGARGGVVVLVSSTWQCGCAVAYRVSDADAAAVLDGLDFREKGGYTRELVDVHAADGSDVKALLYTGTPENPMFDAAMIADLDAAARTIGTSVGPSGPNREYLLNLARWLEDAGEEDSHVAGLVARLPPVA